MGAAHGDQRLHSLVDLKEGNDAKRNNQKTTKTKKNKKKKEKKGVAGSRIALKAEAHGCTSSPQRAETLT